MKKQTKAVKHAKAHAERINGRLTNRPVPTFEPGGVFASAMSGPCIVIAKDGHPYRFDVDAGTIESIRWAR